jgi:hypothetical protein
MDENDADYYEQIKLFEQNSEDMITLLKQQLCVVKSSIGAVNNTLTDVEYKERLIKEGIQKITNYTDLLKAETREKMDIFGAKIEIEGHMLRVNNAINTLQRKSDMLISNVVNAQKGVLQPQVISPRLLMESLTKSISAFPKGTILPFPLSKDSSHLVLRVSRMKVYTKEGILAFVILLPLINRGTFKIYKLIPIPVPLDKS